MKQLSARTPLWLRLAAIPLGGFGLIWLSFEDTHTLTVLTLGSAICLWLCCYWLSPIASNNWKGFALHALGGMLAGTAVIPVTLLLMALKTGLHAHPEPDFSAQQILSLLDRLPIWSAAGLLSGLAAGLWRSQLTHKPGK